MTESNFLSHTKPSSELRFRQIHLDFHTSEKIGDVGRDFDPKQFQQMLQRGHVDSVTLFSKCHHGMSYHETKVGVRHPGMKDDLLPLQLEACRAIDVKTPIYISVGWDEAMASAHPDWVRREKNGKTPDPLVPGWKYLCLNSPYLDYLCAQIEEVVDLFGARDGIFLDIVSESRCYCKWCLRSMEAESIDPSDDAQADQYAHRVLETYYARTTASSKKGDEARRVFHNSGHIPKGAHDALKWNSHLELESLPTGGWGYDHFPSSAKYAATTGFDFLGMTGKFHTSWGEFGGYKRKTALQYECAAMLAFGSKCSVGDQLHPRGALNEDTYELIGAAYAQVEAKEAWCHGAKPVSEIALVSPEALIYKESGRIERNCHSEIGASRMLLEMQLQFDVVDLDRDLSGYKLVILPDEITLGGDFLEKIKSYVAHGGKLLMSGDSGLKPERDAFALDCGLELVGRSEWNPDYILPTEHTPTPQVRGAFVIHGGAWDVKIADENANAGANAQSAESSTRSSPSGAWQTMAGRARPYFNREWNHFCSHQHTPDSEALEHAAMLGNGQIVYFAHAIFTRYRFYGQPLYRDLVQDAIAALIGAPLVQASLGSAGRASLMRQHAENRYVLHLLHATPSLRGGVEANGEAFASWSIEVIEDILPVHDVKCQVRVAEPVRNVVLQPSGEEIEYSTDGETLAFTVPRLLCHQMVELKY